jgi:hypothetical protein
MRTSDAAKREPLIYDRFRDELWAIARAWLRDGGALPEHAQLEKDLHAPEFASNLQGKLKATPKRDLKKLLGRSPDVGDAFVLSCYVPRKWIAGMPQEEAPPPAASVYDSADEQTVSHDPYASGFV